MSLTEEELKTLSAEHIRTYNQELNIRKHHYEVFCIQRQLQQYQQKLIEEQQHLKDAKKKLRDLLKQQKYSATDHFGNCLAEGDRVKIVNTTATAKAGSIGVIEKCGKGQYQNCWCTIKLDRVILTYSLLATRKAKNLKSLERGRSRSRKEER